MDNDILRCDGKVAWGKNVANHSQPLIYLHLHVLFCFFSPLSRAIMTKIKVMQSLKSKLYL